MHIGSKFDQLFSVLSNQRCRYVLFALQDAGTDAVDLRDIAPLIANWETPCEIEPTESYLEEVKISLHHHHLPKLSSRGVIDYDPRSKAIRYYGDTTLETWLGQVKQQELSLRDRIENHEYVD
ncbi:DUF7344 domain-containing protein [Natronococcus jeotgali]